MKIKGRRDDVVQMIYQSTSMKMDATGENVTQKDQKLTENGQFVGASRKYEGLL
jgi:hypothetical protein